MIGLPDPSVRRLAALLEAAPPRLTATHRWLTGDLPDDGADGVQRHAVPTLVLCLRGMVRTTGAPGRIDLRAGEALLIGTGIWHRHHPLRPGCIALGLGEMGPVADLAIGDHVQWLSGAIPRDPASRWLREALTAADADQRRMIVQRLVGVAMAEQVRPLETGPPAVDAMRHALWSRLHLGLTAADLVRASGLGRSQALALFTKAYGCPPRRFLERCRLDMAAAMLAAGKASGEIADACGFPSRAAFTRAWRLRHGVAPRFAGLNRPERPQPGGGGRRPD